MAIVDNLHPIIVACNNMKADDYFIWSFLWSLEGIMQTITMNDALPLNF